ncbi:hypothetical protein AB1N83_011853 [Pleurotus pulmonarius]
MSRIIGGTPSSSMRRLLGVSCAIRSLPGRTRGMSGCAKRGHPLDIPRFQRSLQRRQHTLRAGLKILRKAGLRIAALWQIFVTSRQIPQGFMGARLYCFGLHSGNVESPFLGIPPVAAWLESPSQLPVVSFRFLFTPSCSISFTTYTRDSLFYASSFGPHRFTLIIELSVGSDYEETTSQCRDNAMEIDEQEQRAIPLQVFNALAQLAFALRQNSSDAT